MSQLPLSERKMGFLALVALLAAVFIGGSMFYSRYPYAEDGTNTLIIVYLAGCAGLYFSVRLWKTALLGLCVTVIAASFIYTSLKFNWRESYIQMAEVGQPFFLEDVIDHYPTFEEYNFSFLGAPDWVRFNDECVQPALKNQTIPPRCASIDLIQRYYRVDVTAMMSALAERMRNTAKMVENGKLTKRSAYIGCIVEKVCAAIPLLPKGVDAKQIDPSSRDYLTVRQAFWSLVNDPKLSPEACELTPLCKALATMKAINPDRLPF